ncbi:hypothetical protein [Methylobacterium sp. J-068]|uniref:hypothetical protein n=1 Tax=Methylobacterium sp. J-068 TaxID=2836649 RepID=UPI001FB911B2|nr:hypothetical protein [Methylobacterium sp. J-068]MCJ2036512.1 hypothetical protein [Methylobacterium sp. J-068]
MAARTHADDAAFGSEPARGVTPPLLPTLMMAAILGAASYFCHEPAVIEAPVPATAVASAPEAVADAPFIPAPLAFQTQFPMIVAARAEAVAVVQPHKAPVRSARIAAPRRADPRVVARATVEKAPTDKAATEKAALAPEKALPFAAEAEEPATSVAASDDGILPEIALPFAPTIRAVTRASAAAGAFMGAKGAALGTFVGAKGAVLGTETATLGAAVSGWVDGLR